MKSLRFCMRQFNNFAKVNDETSRDIFVQGSDQNCVLESPDGRTRPGEDRDLIHES